MRSSNVALTSALLVAFLAMIPACSDSTTPADDNDSSGGGGSSSDSSGSTGGNGGAGGSGGEGGAAGAGGMGGSGGGSIYCAPDTIVVTPNGANAFDIRTDHYDLYAQAPQKEAEEMGRLLEASYPAMQDYFEAAPPLTAGQRLSVRFFIDQATWAAALTADGITVPNEAGGYYSHTNSVAYLYKQGNPYSTRQLLIHEAVHQYHFLSRVKDTNLPYWYVEGVAEYLGRHDWDSNCVNLGVVPLMSWEDLPEEALNSTIDFPGIINGSVSPTRAASWAIYRFLELGEGGAHKASFKTFRDAMDGNQPNPSFSTMVGEPAALAPALEAYLPTAQEPMMPIYTEWHHVGQRAVFADSGAFFSLAVTKAAVNHFETLYDVPTTGTWGVGVVLGYDDPQNFKSLLIKSNGQVQTFQAVNGTYTTNNVGFAAASLGNGTGSISVDYPSANEAKVNVNGTASTHALTVSTQSGLAIDSSATLFHHIDWN